MSITLCMNSEEARCYVRRAQRDGQTVGFVPTMGALHQGHLSLVQASAAECDTTVVSIFVNPTQFGPQEDFEEYPRDLERDQKLLADVGVDMVFAPQANDMYRARHSTFVLPPQVAQRWEGEMRPEHFRGVTTVVLKLFQIVPADFAFLGQKDFQQVRVIEDMCDDLDLAVGIRTCPTVREPDGLALSSRNAYLSSADRERALSLSQALNGAVAISRQGSVDAERVRAQVLETLNSAPVDSIDYVAIVDPRSLEPVAQVVPGTMLLLAAHVGGTRLIDNARLG